MKNSELDKKFAVEGVLKVISNELAGLDLSTSDYIQFANSILDSALKKDPDHPDAASLYQLKLSKLPLATDQFYIRACEPEKDYPVFKKWTEDERGREFLLSRLENNFEQPEKLFFNDVNLFGIVCLPAGRPIGIVGFLNYHQKQKKAELRKLIGEPGYRGKGLGKKASRLWLGYGLYALKLRKIYLYTFDSNLRNIRINEELGFKLEGVFRAEHLINGEPKDILRMSLLYP